jgi:hypothetical protein
MVRITECPLQIAPTILLGEETLFMEVSGPRFSDFTIPKLATIEPPWFFTDWTTYVFLVFFTVEELADVFPCPAAKFDV